MERARCNGLMKGVVVGIFVGILCHCATAATPVFSMAPFKVTLTPPEKGNYNSDSAHTQDGKLVYDLVGQVFANGDGTITAASGVTPRSTPWETLSEMFAAYQANDPNALQALFVSGSDAQGPVQYLSDPKNKEQTSKLTQGIVLFGYQWHGLFYAMIKLPALGPYAAIPYRFKLVGKQYLLTQQSDKARRNMNFFLAVCNFQRTPADIITGYQAPATPQTVNDIQKEAVAMYPGLAQAGSAVNAKFVELYHQAQKNDPDSLTTPFWPIFLAGQAGDPVESADEPSRPAPPPADDTAAQANYFGKLDHGLRWKKQEGGKAKQFEATVTDADFKNFWVKTNPDFFASSWIRESGAPDKVMIYVWPNYPDQASISQAQLISGDHEVWVSLTNE